MNGGDSPVGAPPPLANALRSAWLRGCTDSRPLAILMVAFDAAALPATAEAKAYLARVMAVHCARLHDTVMERGPGEFAALLPDTAPAGARSVAEQIVEAMREGDAHPTISVGIAVSVPDERHEPATLLLRAQAALRSAREQGGDRCAGGGFSSPSPGPKRIRLLPWNRRQERRRADRRGNGP